jgi:hypothetical protein
LEDDLTMKILFCFLLVLWAATPARSQSSTATGTSSAFNPAISVNGLFLGYYQSDLLMREPVFGHEHEGEEIELAGEHGHGLADETGLHVQEVEVRFTSIVDAYFKADMVIAIPGTEGVELEEATIATTHLPNIIFKTGKFYGDFGKHNLLHTHAFPFLDSPLINERILGGEGLNEVGVGASLLLPVSWYSEWNGQVFNGDNALFNSANGNDLAYLGHWKNLWDVNDDATLELGGSYTFGKNEHTKMTQIFGGDLTFKWRSPKPAHYRTFVLQAEYIQARVNDGLDIESVGGFYVLMQYQFARRGWFQARYDVLGLPKIEAERDIRFSGLLALVTSEFSALRLQYNLNREGGRNIQQLAVQLNVTLGAHPAHAY